MTKRAVSFILLFLLTASVAPAQTRTPFPAPPTDYIIGAEDILAVVFWRDKDMSLEVTVRPDGKITLPLLNDVQAAGLTPSELCEQLEKDASKFIEDRKS